MHQKIMREIAISLGVSDSAITPTLTFQELNIDSLDHVEMAMLMEDEFHICIPDAVCAEWTKISDVIKTVEELCAGKTTS